MLANLLSKHSLDIIESPDDEGRWKVSIWAYNQIIEDDDLDDEDGWKIEDETLLEFSPKRARMLATEINRLADIAEEKNEQQRNSDELPERVDDSATGEPVT